jgi:signal transduction histidine kinase
MKVRWSLRTKLLASYGLVIAASVGVTGLAGRWLFARHAAELSHQAAMSGLTIEHFVTTLDRALLGSTLAALAVAALLGLLLAGLIVKPLREMTAVARRLAAGDYKQRVAVQSQDEVSELAAAFNEMAAGLAATERMRRDLVANVAHELRTPLTSIEGYMEALEDGVFPADPTTYRRIRDEAARLRRLVEDLSALAKAEAPDDWARAPVRLDRLAAEATKTLRPRFEAEGVMLAADLPADGALILGDADRLRQALDNLLDNALRHTPPGGRVIVRVQPADGFARLTVADTGHGIVPEDLPHIFERFYRGDKSRARTTGGAGIGLTIVKHVVERHGGRIEVESAPGRGSMFTVVLPLRED